MSFDVILDTGSSCVSVRDLFTSNLNTIIYRDLWLISSTCGAVCGSSPAYDPATSSSFQNLSTPFEITYGSGAAAGYLAEETVQMAGFSVQKQGFGTFLYTPNTVHTSDGSCGRRRRCSFVKLQPESCFGVDGSCLVFPCLLRKDAILANSS
jgi:hypothetical protein